jgi:hypothetical protein
MQVHGHRFELEPLALTESGAEYDAAWLRLVRRL